MATVSVRGTGTATAQPDDVTVGLGVEPVDVPCPLEQA